MPEELRARVLAAISSLAKGPGATIEAVSEQPDLVALECVVSQATGDGRSPASLDEIAHTVIVFLEEAANSLEQEPDATTVPNRAKAARAALSLKPELVGRPYQAVKGRKGRQTVIAEWLDIAKESLDDERQDGTTPMTELVLPVAQHLVRSESAYLAEIRRRAQRAQRPPLESAMRVEWLGRFERYYKIWSTLSGLRYDLEMSIHYLSRDEHNRAEFFIRKSMYYHACFLDERDDFVSQHGGLWVLPDTTTEDDITDAVWFVRKATPCGAVEESILCMVLDRSPQLALFLHETFVARSLQPVLSAWRKWIASCRCARPKRPRRDCYVHATIEWARFYMKAVDDQWDFLSDWYDLPRRGTAIDPVRQVRRGHPVFPPPLPIDKPAPKR